MRLRARLVSLLWRWHRRLGLAASAFVLFLALSGIALNHSSGLALDHTRVSSSLVYALYGVEPPAPRAYRAADYWVSQVAGEELYFDAQPVARCSGELVGALAQGDYLVLACAEEVLLFTADGELLESLGIGAGLPVPLQALGREAGGLLLKAGGQFYPFDPDLPDFVPRPEAGDEVQLVQAAELPAELAGQLPGGLDWLTWERVLLDLHSGRLAGPLGVALVDALGVILCVLGLSGFAMWWLHRRRG